MNNEGRVGSATTGAETLSTVSTISLSVDKAGGKPTELPLGEQALDVAEEQELLLLLLLLLLSAIDL